MKTLNVSLQLYLIVYSYKTSRHRVKKIEKDQKSNRTILRRRLFSF